MPTGLVIFCIEYAGGTKSHATPVLQEVKSSFGDLSAGELEEALRAQYDFRNTYVAHEKHEPLQSVEVARPQLSNWIKTLELLRDAGPETSHP